MDTADVDQYIE